MKSLEQIKSDLNDIAKNNGIEGESVDMIVDMVAYALYHDQVEILNTAKELSLSDSTMIDSKIAQCCNVMYSVYRGENPTLTVNTLFNTKTTIDKFQLLYQGSTFYWYAPNSIEDIDPGLREYSGIVSRSPLVDKTYTINVKNRYYLDFVDDDDNPYSSISNHIRVFVGSSESTLKEIGTTRMFSEHAKSNDTLFALTIPDFGIRLFRKNYFDVGSIVRIQGIVYSTLDDVNTDEFRKVSIKNTEAKKYDNTGLTYISRAGVSRSDGRSLLHEANFANRVNHQIQSNSDVCYFFNEHFISDVKSSTFIYTENNLTIYYIPIIDFNKISDDKKTEFINNYTNYFLAISSNSNGVVNTTSAINIKESTGIEIIISIGVVCGENITNEVDKILSEYNYNLGKRINLNQLRTRLSKIEPINYIKNIEYKIDDISKSVPYLIENGTTDYGYLDLKINEFVKFVPSITYYSDESAD